MTVSDFQRGFATAMVFQIINENHGDMIDPDILKEEIRGLLHGFGLAFPTDAELIDIYKITEAINNATPRQDNLQA